MRWALVAIATAAIVAAFVANLAQSASGAQPWDSELGDNFIFARSVPFTIALGVTVGLLRVRTRADWFMGAGLLIALPTGMWQYLGGILDVEAPFPLFWVYRVHYIGATLVLFATTALALNWWLAGDRSMLVPNGQWLRHLRGLAHELPAPLGTALASTIGLDMKRPRPEAGAYSFYDKVVTYPSWTVAIVLITVTGILKAVRYVWPIPGPILFLASTLHVVAMVIITIKVLDQLRIELARWGAARVRAALALVWAALNAAVALLFLANAFTAKTAAKEGIIAQLSLLIGGLLIGAFAVFVARRCILTFTQRATA